MWQQQQIILSEKSRGFHLITNEVVLAIQGLSQIKIGLLHLQLLHTSASLTLNENADPTVRSDFEQYFNRLAKENESYYRHTYEGSDDMPAHLKASLLGSQLTLSVTDGRLNLGTWQGIYLGEHRNDGGNRKIIATLQGQT